jgi:hypothetical protein
LNGAVLVGVAVVVAVLAALVVGRAVRKRRRDEIRSVGHYHERLDTLHVAPQDRGGSVRFVEDTAPPEVHADPDRPRLDPESAHLEPWAPPPTQRQRRHRHDQQWAMRRMQPRARVDTGTLLVVAIVAAVLVAIALAGYLIQRGRGTATTTTTTLPQASTTTTTPPSSLTAATVTGGLAVYHVPSASYGLAVSAVGGREWLQLTVPPLSSHIVTKVLASGASTTSNVTGASDLELGAPSAARVTVNGIAVVLPARFTPPLTLRFEPPSGVS